MAKVRNITDKTWRLFEKGRNGKSANKYLEYILCNQSNDKLLKALKSDLRECVEKYGQLSAANKDLKRKIKNLKAELKEIKEKNRYIEPEIYEE